MQGAWTLCWKQYLHISVNTEMLSWFVSRVFTLADYCSWSVCHQRRKANINRFSYKPFDLQWQPVCMICCAIVVQKLQGQPTTICWELRLAPWDRTHAWYCSGGQEPDTRWSMHLGGKSNTILLLTEHSNLMIPNNFLLYSQIILREASSWSRWELMQRPKPGQCAWSKRL